ncbi:hypothetical protein [Donghicola tyrosinivorans]|uniref:Uncharacterized protein n=1 Tax=Donghicola tyrosinivorans TaxID=1652492 RepID=A0A2T0WYQ7_9RHOB|nr:hypothetical protein [Donghicola tyrosinivorans]PRY91734.1 hypothetical protein CLV74_103323 [Donghicola tyrosinivorans]
MYDPNATFAADTRLCLPGGFALFMLRCRGTAPREDIENLLALGLIVPTPAGLALTQKGRDLTDPHPIGMNDGNLLTMSCILSMQGIGPLDVMVNRAETIITPESFLPNSYVCKFQSRLAELSQHGLDLYRSGKKSALRTE